VYISLISSVRATCPGHVIFINFLILIAFGEAYHLKKGTHFRCNEISSCMSHVPTWECTKECNSAA
jgi:hypothetical protein